MFLSWPAGGGLYGDNGAYIDDLIIWDNAGSEMNTASRLGPHRIRSLFPSANGTYNQFSGYANTGGNWNALRTTDDDSSFAEANTNGSKSSFLFDNIPGNPTKIPAISVRVMQKNPDIGQKQFSLFAKNGTVEVNSNNTIMSAGLFYAYSPNSMNPIVYHSNPNSNIAWTSSSWANTELGIKVES